LELANTIDLQVYFLKIDYEGEIWVSKPSFSPRFLNVMVIYGWIEECV